MKRSRLFLGATASLLAIAGIAAANAHRISTNVFGYYVGSDQSCDNQFLSQNGLTINSKGIHQTLRTNGVLGATVYSQRSTGSTCPGSPLYTTHE
jgi:hypothetical protein